MIWQLALFHNYFSLKGHTHHKLFTKTNLGQSYVQKCSANLKLLTERPHFSHMTISMCSNKCSSFNFSSENPLWQIWHLWHFDACWREWLRRVDWLAKLRPQDSHKCLAVPLAWVCFCTWQNILFRSGDVKLHTLHLE